MNYTMIESGRELFDIEYRTWDEEIFAKGVELVKDYTEKHDDVEVLIGNYTIIIGEVDDIHGYNLNDIAQALEDLGFRGKWAQYREVHNV